VTGERAWSANFQEQRAGAAGGIVDSGVAGSVGGADGEDLGDDAADFRRRIELAFALATLGGEVAHQIFVGIAEDVIAIGAFLEKSRICSQKMAMTSSAMPTNI